MANKAGPYIGCSCQCRQLSENFKDHAASCWITTTYPTWLLKKKLEAADGR